jgi:hypothetical protein
MMKFIPTAFAAAVALGGLSGCIDRANAPTLVPVGTPAQPAMAVHALCVGDANAAYNRQIEEFNKRATMTNQFTLTQQASYDQINQAKSAAHLKYLSCVASQGYRPIY